MPRFKLTAPGPWGEKSANDYSYSMVMEVDGRVELSGQGGWHPDTLDFPTGLPIEAEINQAFENVAFMLNSVGLDWSQVARPNLTVRSLQPRRRWRFSSGNGCPITARSGHAWAWRCWDIRPCASKFG